MYVSLNWRFRKQRKPRFDGLVLLRICRSDVVASWLRPCDSKDTVGHPQVSAAEGRLRRDLSSKSVLPCPTVPRATLETSPACETSPAALCPGGEAETAAGEACEARYRRRRPISTPTPSAAPVQGTIAAQQRSASPNLECVIDAALPRGIFPRMTPPRRLLDWIGLTLPVSLDRCPLLLHCPFAPGTVRITRVSRNLNRLSCAIQQFQVSLAGWQPFERGAVRRFRCERPGYGQTAAHFAKRLFPRCPPLKAFEKWATPALFMPW